VGRERFKRRAVIVNRCEPAEVEDHMTSPARVRSSSLIPLVKRSQAPLLAAPHYAHTGTSPIVTSLAHVPEALDVTLPFVSVVLGPSAIDGRTKELVILRTSGLLECRYCIQTHSAAALDRGVTATEVRALRDGTTWETAFTSRARRVNSASRRSGSPEASRS